MIAHELFELLAATTWRTIDRASGRRILFGEDAITSVNLLMLADGKNGTYAVEDTRVNESTKGCDFELWIGSSHAGWSRYAVQAKKIRSSTDSYAQLKHEVGGTLKIDILETYADLNGAAPIYCLYNHSKQRGDWSCCLPEEQSQLGCSVTPSTIIRNAINTKRGGKSFTKIHQDSRTVPWRCLVRCHSSGSNGCTRSICADGSNNNVHAKLPEQLEYFTETGESAQLIDPGSMFSPDSFLRPQWVVVVNVQNERGVA